MSIDTLPTVFGDVAAAAVGAALWTVRLTYRGLDVGRQTVDLTVAAGEDARALLEVAGQARAAAEEARQAAAAQQALARLERLRERGERVGQLARGFQAT